MGGGGGGGGEGGNTAMWPSKKAVVAASRVLAPPARDTDGSQCNVAGGERRTVVARKGSLGGPACLGARMCVTRDGTAGSKSRHQLHAHASSARHLRTRGERGRAVGRGGGGAAGQGQRGRASDRPLPHKAQAAHRVPTHSPRPACLPSPERVHARCARSVDSPGSPPCDRVERGGGGAQGEAIKNIDGTTATPARLSPALPGAIEGSRRPFLGHGGAAAGWGCPIFL